MASTANTGGREAYLCGQIFGLKAILMATRAMHRDEKLWLRGTSAVKDSVPIHYLFRVEMLTDGAEPDGRWLLTVYDALREGKETGRGRRNFMLTKKRFQQEVDYAALRIYLSRAVGSRVRTIQASAIDEHSLTQDER